MVEAKVIGGQFFSFLYSFDYLSTEVNQRKTKRCNYPNSLTESSRKVGIISLPVLSHHRTYRSVYGGSLSFDSNLLVLVGEKCESCLS